ncbi:hypothetical protein [Bdellovibrio sp. HCB337]|uniref:hypothetical protein n=1 Tax=Bdellovibrio sp. HCB337 TaxID=3394358 RepID=UPI0039A61EC3
MSALSFHFRNALFSFRESWTNLANGLLGFLLFPVFMFILANMWLKFNSHLGNYTYQEMLAYIGVTEVLYMTFLRSGNIMQASGDFSLSLARPRSWLATQGSALFGKTLGSRLVMTTLLFFLLLAFGIGFSTSLTVVFRLAMLLVPLGFMQVFYSLLFSSAQVRWEMTNYLTLPFGKLFLVFGGVFAPVSDFSEPARSILMALPPSDLFFQPAYYAIKGSFYQLSAAEWALRLVLQAIALMLLNAWFFKNSRHHHQSFGG